MSSTVSVDRDGNALQGRAKRAYSTISAENTWVELTPTVMPQNAGQVARKDYPRGYYNLTCVGTWNGKTLTLQRSFDDGSTWYDLATKTADFTGEFHEARFGVRIRAGFKTGQAPTSVYVELNQ